MKKIPVNSIFGPTIQGEGPVVGRPTMFVRVFGCDSRCRMCDSLDAVDAKRTTASFKRMTVPEICGEVEKLSGGRRIPVTLSGGNPALYDLTELVEELRQIGHERFAPLREVWVETQGTVYHRWLADCDKVVVSPKGPGMDDRKKGTLSVQDLQDFYVSLVRGGMGRDAFFIKVVCFGPDDLAYAELLNNSFMSPKPILYLSVGNSNPEAAHAGLVRDELVRDFRALCEAVAAREGLENAIVLPQLHVLAYGNRKDV